MLHTEPVACHAHRTWRRSTALRHEKAAVGESSRDRGVERRLFVGRAGCRWLEVEEALYLNNCGPGAHGAAFRIPESLVLLREIRRVGGGDRRRGARRLPLLLR